MENIKQLMIEQLESSLDFINHKINSDANQSLMQDKASILRQISVVKEGNINEVNFHSDYFA